MKVNRLRWKNTPWTHYLESRGMRVSPSVVANVEKVLLAQHAIVFLSSHGSTFSFDIDRLRLGLKHTNFYDHTLCNDC